ncbi:DUF6245 family protein [Streptomyces sp. NPDC018833]
MTAENTPEEHAEEAARLGGPNAYRVRTVTAEGAVPRAMSSAPR